MPQVGEHTRDYAALDDYCFITHGCDGDWVVERVSQFSSPNSDQRLVVCYCSYQPVERRWEEVDRGVPVAEMLEPVNV